MSVAHNYFSSTQRTEHYFQVRVSTRTPISSLLLLLFLKALVLFRFPQICSEAVDNIRTVASLNRADIFIDKLDHLLDGTSRYAHRVREGGGEEGRGGGRSSEKERGK